MMAVNSGISEPSTICSHICQLNQLECKENYVRFVFLPVNSTHVTHTNTGIAPRKSTTSNKLPLSLIIASKRYFRM